MRNSHFRVALFLAGFALGFVTTMNVSRALQVEQVHADFVLRLAPRAHSI